jgi:hypothetical protein
VTYPPREILSSVGGLRETLSVRFFDTACSRNEVLALLSRRPFEKLPVCDLPMLRLNILGRNEQYIVKMSRESRWSVVGGR